MRPVLTKNKLSRKLWILYSIIFIICTIGIGVALYLQYYQDEKIGVVLGITAKESEEEDKYNDIKSEFIDGKLFTNDFEIIGQNPTGIKKIKENYDLVVTAFKYEKNEENSTINVAIPYINVDNTAAIEFDKKIRDEYKITAEELMKKENEENTIYTVEYKAYIQNNILSLAIKSGYKEGTKSQKVLIKTFNYSLTENREVTIDEILKIKNINEKEANNKIKDEIKEIQKQNEALKEALGGQTTLYQRNPNSDIYDISNCKQFLYGKNERLYIIYAYGNDTETNEMDVVIFQ